MSHAETCPVCKGLGTIPVGELTTDGAKKRDTCNGCFGKGWVVILEEDGGVPIPYMIDPKNIT